MTGIKVTKQNIEEREEAWRVSLPEAYKAYLLEENGGEPAKRHFVMGEEICVIERYLSIISDSSSELKIYDIDVVLTQVDERIVADGEQLGYSIIPVAALYGGDFLCYDYRENSEKPELCVWDHEESDEFEPVTYYVCEDWEELQAMLR